PRLSRTCPRDTTRRGWVGDAFFFSKKLRVPPSPAIPTRLSTIPHTRCGCTRGGPCHPDGHRTPPTRGTRERRPNRYGLGKNRSLSVLHSTPDGPWSEGQDLTWSWTGRAGRCRRGCGPPTGAGDRTGGASAPDDP